MRNIFRKDAEGRKKQGARRKKHFALSLAYCFLLPASFFLSSCLQVARPSFQIGLVAPFEGRYREVGYEVIYAVRLAVREANVAGGVAGYSVELLSLDDSGQPEQASEQARKMAVDPQVLGVIGDWLDKTTLAAAPTYTENSIPFLATTSSPELTPGIFRLWPTEAALHAAFPDPTATRCFYPCGDLEDLDWLNQADSNSHPPMSNLESRFPPSAIGNPQSAIVGGPLWEQRQFPLLAGSAAERVYFITPAPRPLDSADPSFADRYRAVAPPGAEPGALAVLAYDATRLLLQAIAEDVKANGTPTRAGTAIELARIRFSGLSGDFSFDSSYNWKEAKGWVYRWKEGKVNRP